jgi:hypothetical protein
VNLWTVGCADPRLTALARSPMETPCFPPPCPQVGGCPQASQHPATTQDEFNFGERVKPAAGYRPLAYSSPEAVQTPGTVVDHPESGEIIVMARFGSRSSDSRIDPND